MSPLGVHLHRIAPLQEWPADWCPLLHELPDVALANLNNGTCGNANDDDDDYDDDDDDDYDHDDDDDDDYNNWVRYENAISYLHGRRLKCSAWARIKRAHDTY